MWPELVEFLEWQHAETWVAVWTFTLNFATLAIAAATVYLAKTVQQQIRSSREENSIQIQSEQLENRSTQTLQACGRYDTDPIIFDCHKTLVVAKEHQKRNDEALITKAAELRLQILTILNFLDAIAIGVNQGFYVKSIAKDHIGPIRRPSCRA